MLRTVIFDLDGTVADSESVFFDIVDELAPRFGFSSVNREDSSRLKHLHLRDFLLQQLGWRIVLLPWILRAGRARYRQLADQVPIFPGISSLFAALHEHGIRIGIVSSSEVQTIEAILRAHQLSAGFIVHSDLFGKARTLTKVLRDQSLAIEETLYVGDELRDVEACQKAGVKIIAATWGLNSKAALREAGAETVDTPEELEARILAS